MIDNEVTASLKGRFATILFKNINNRLCEHFFLEKQIYVQKLQKRQIGMNQSQCNC